jgi:hypothetical protein
MTELARALPNTDATLERERLLRLLALTAFIIFFQGYMVAPIIPLLSTVLQAPEQATRLPSASVAARSCILLRAV